MQDERIKPTDGMRCTKTCPSFNAKTCMVCGEFKISAENDSSGFGSDRCTPAQDAIQDTYQASRKKAPRQEYRIIKRPFTSELIDSVNAAQQEGWRVAGGVIMNHSVPQLYMQAMVRDAPAVLGQEDMPEGFYIPDRRPTDPQ